MVEYYSLSYSYYLTRVNAGANMHEFPYYSNTSELFDVIRQHGPQRMGIHRPYIYMSTLYTNTLKKIIFTVTHYAKISMYRGKK